MSTPREWAPYALRVAVLTISDKASSGERADAGGPTVREVIEGAKIGAVVVDAFVVPDEQATITEALFHLTERTDVDLVLTTGGTGLAPRDVTPQATLSIVDYEVPGMAEAMRAESLKITAAAMLSRGVVGVRNRTLIVNLPGNPKAVREMLPILIPVLPHAISTLRGEIGEHTRPS